MFSDHIGIDLERRYRLVGEYQINGRDETN